MTLSAAFTVNGDANPGTHIVTISSTVNLALTSTSGVSLIEWSIVEAWRAGQTLPTITPAGVPSGATASFPFDVTPGTISYEGYSYLVKCRVSNSAGESAEEYAIVGIKGHAGFVPFVPGEELARSLTHGWGESLNKALPRTEPTIIARVQISGGTPAVTTFISRVDGVIVGNFTVLDNGAGDTTITLPSGILSGQLPPAATLDIAAGSIATAAAATIISAAETDGARVVTQNVTGGGWFPADFDFLLYLW